MLAALGFPIEYIYVQGQKHADVQREKQSHWAMTCVDPLTKSMHNIGHASDMQVVFNKNIKSLKAFAVFTRDIIYYYDWIALQFYKGVEERGMKEFILRHLRTEYDFRFGKDHKKLQEIKTPTR